MKKKHIKERKFWLQPRNVLNPEVNVDGRAVSCGLKRGSGAGFPRPNRTQERASALAGPPLLKALDCLIEKGTDNHFDFKVLIYCMF